MIGLQGRGLSSLLLKQNSYRHVTQPPPSKEKSSKLNPHMKMLKIESREEIRMCNRHPHNLLTLVLKSNSYTLTSKPSTV